jgi:hypothetical protein
MEYMEYIIKIDLRDNVGCEVVSWNELEHWRDFVIKVTNLLV